MAVKARERYLEPCETMDKEAAYIEATRGSLRTFIEAQ
jgi:hypothetical protein